MRLWPFHHHRYFEVDREWMESRLRNAQGLTLAGPTPITKITERCADKLCGKYRQQTLVGHLPGGHPGKGAMLEEAVVDE